MKAALCTSLDGHRAIELVDVSDPSAGPSQVIVRVTAVGLNFADTLIARGAYQFKPDLPFSPGAEIAGVIETVGEGVQTFKAGQRVFAYINWGGARERVAVPEDALVPLPDDIDDVTAAGLSVTYGTAVHGLIDRGHCQSGQSIVVTGAAGGAGQAAVEIATLLGARVIAVASSDEKLVIARACGAQEGLLFPGSDLKTSVRDLTGGRGADIVYDCIGGDAAEPLVRALNWTGRFLVVGFASGDIPRIPINLLLLRGAEIAGVFWGESVRRDPAGHRQNMQRVVDWVASGALKPKLHCTFSLEEIVQALDVLASRQAEGKIVLTL